MDKTTTDVQHDCRRLVQRRAQSDIASPGDLANDVALAGLFTPRGQPDPWANVLRRSEPIGIINVPSFNGSLPAAASDTGTVLLREIIEISWPQCYMSQKQESLTPLGRNALGSQDVLVLCLLVPTAQQDDQDCASLLEIHAVPRPIVDPHF